MHSGNLPIKVSLVEDNQQIRQFLSELITGQPNLLLMAAYASCEDAIAQLDHFLPQVILMDIELPGMNGIEGTLYIKRQYPSVEIIMVTVLEQSESVFNALKAGACGYLTKTSNKDQIVQAIVEAASGGAPMSSKIARMVINAFSVKANSPLTEKEETVLNLLAKGKGYKSIAVLLDISVDTVKFHIKNIYIKLQVNNKEDALTVARNNHWLSKLAWD